MGKRYISADVQCPYYASEDGRHIYHGEGPVSRSYITLAFESTEALKRYKKGHCNRYPGYCLLREALDRKNES